MSVKMAENRQKTMIFNTFMLITGPQKGKNPVRPKLSSKFGIPNIILMNSTGLGLK